MRFDPRAPEVVVSPHLDDAALGAWSRLIRDGDVQVVNVCTGIPPRGLLTLWDRVVGAEESASLVEQRLREDREALAMAGRSPVSLGFLDCQYRNEPLEPRDVRIGIEVEIPASSRIYAPAGIGGHDDHLVSRAAALELSADGVPVFLYAELPYAAPFGWPHWVTKTRPDPRLNTDAYWDHFLSAIPPCYRRCAPSVYTFPKAEARAKIAALARYRSQFAFLNGGPLNRLKLPAIISHETFWQIESA